LNVTVTAAGSQPSAGPPASRRRQGHRWHAELQRAAHV